MSAGIDQKTYLQKYLTGKSADKKKKKKKAVKGKGYDISCVFHIIFINNILHTSGKDSKI